VSDALGAANDTAAPSATDTQPGPTVETMSEPVDTLAFTGSTTALLTVAGIVMLALGTVMTRGVRRRRTR
jgi:hypothetical protein